jgi:hypothetical protein
MKPIHLILLFFLVFSVACGVRSVSTDQPLDGNGESSHITTKDSVEYELVIFDSDFDSWYFQFAKPKGYYGQRHLESWNERLVHQWNTFSPGRGRHDCRPISYVDYSPTIDYGIELNHKLYHYFRYMHQRCRIFYSRPGDW